MGNMQTGEESGVAGGEKDDKGEKEGGRSERIGVGGGDDGVARIQLAARWAEAFAPAYGDSLGNALKRFRTAYDYLDSVIHGVEPPHLDGAG
jgi:hypothetical protein